MVSWLKFGFQEKEKDKDEEDEEDEAIDPTMCGKFMGFKRSRSWSFRSQKDWDRCQEQPTGQNLSHSMEKYVYNKSTSRKM